mmetsp:Transcript_20648/g.38491  ORF Transcript_20648/g.38491 Transcript_20648/m.38491 type:complete len:212 (-) Transcript_20648:885-1520(-)|eukprot:CAMPEP_0204897396 /NCGR_PEP_ID=MMETSP1397-20131031/714_1 /ASSEMBLY_ACC=CAM_ASM_000891 /TAXON_ID=49980 /ORGANISM="Climacostomum Climacostomum virens, Strain Stock W-24" /LENGTH=211 /DNA_ID=CAMNT_0052065139 /DNA_START=34 /DNA_END=669 /DNA_ORIENTATION=-
MKLKQGNAALERLAHSCKKNHTRQSLILPKPHKENTSLNHSFGIEYCSKADLSVRYTEYHSPVSSPAGDSISSSFTNSLQLLDRSLTQTNESFSLSFIGQDQSDAQLIRELKTENEKLRKQLDHRDREVAKLKSLLKAIGMKCRDKIRLADNIKLKPDTLQMSPDVIRNATEIIDSKLEERNRRITELQGRLKTLYEQHHTIERNYDRDRF